MFLLMSLTFVSTLVNSLLHYCHLSDDFLGGLLLHQLLKIKNADTNNISNQISTVFVTIMSKICELCTKVI